MGEAGCFSEVMLKTRESVRGWAWQGVYSGRVGDGFRGVDALRLMGMCMTYKK